MVEEEIYINPDQVQPISLISPWCFQASKTIYVTKILDFHLILMIITITIHNVYFICRLLIYRKITEMENSMHINYYVK